MGWTPEQYQSYQNRRAASGAKPKPPVRDEPIRPTEGEKVDSGKVLVGIRSFRGRLTDPDNLCPKYFIDCLRYAGLIRDDRAKDIQLKIEQFQAPKEQQRTEITIEYPDGYHQAGPHSETTRHSEGSPKDGDTSL